MTSKIIQFPNTKASDETKKALALELKMKVVEANINTIMLSKHWDVYNFTAVDWEMLAMFGDIMRFDPLAASRVISKQADFVARMSQDLLEGDPY